MIDQSGQDAEQAAEPGGHLDHQRGEQWGDQCYGRCGRGQGAKTSIAQKAR